MILSRTVTKHFLKPLTLSLAISVTLLASASVQADAVYAPVKPSDTLSKIINRIYTGPRANRLSVMKQIVSDNPAAFLNGDMNRLKLNASLNLSGDDWKNVRSVSPQGIQGGRGAVNGKAVSVSSSPVASDSIDRSAPELTVEQMKGRIVFLDAERSSLIEQVSELKRETQRLESKLVKLETESKQSDEQLRILDAEIIRLTSLLKNNEIKTSAVDLNQLVVLQEKLRLVQKETSALRAELASTKSQLATNTGTSTQTNETIAKLTQENRKLQKLLQANQPGAYYTSTSDDDYKLSFMSGKFQLPLGVLVAGGALLLIMLTALLATRKKHNKIAVVTKKEGVNPFEETKTFSALLETESVADESRGFAQNHTQPEENVFKMFDEGSLEIDLKLDMAEAYIKVFDFDSALVILQEVVERGSELQKRKAARLIKKAA